MWSLGGVCVLGICGGECVGVCLCFLGGGGVSVRVCVFRCLWR